MAGQHRRDLARLDAEPAHLHLIVHPADELQIAVGAVADAIARGIQPGARSPLNGSGMNLRAVSSGWFR